MGRHSMVEEPPPRPPDGRTSTAGPRRTDGVSTDAHRTIGAPTGERPGYSTGQRRAVTTTGEQSAVTATGHHRAIGKSAARRRIATWPFVAVAVVVLVTFGMLAWDWANSVVDNRAEAQANNCAEGDSSMRVLVAPSAGQAVSATAAKWNNTRTVVHAHCVHIDVQSVVSVRVFDALTGDTGLDTTGGLPAAWIPEATDWASRLAAARPDLVASPAQPLTTAYTYVCLSGADLDEVAVRAAQMFRAFLLDPAQVTGLNDAARP